VFGTRNYFYGFIFDWYIQNNELWFTTPTRRLMLDSPERRLTVGDT
jgi:hypothetical protein